MRRWWRASDPRRAPSRLVEQHPPLEWQVGSRFLYGNGAQRLLLPARAVMLLLGLGVAVYAFLWARALFGPGAGLLALGLAAFSPNLLAHTRLVTTDVGLALFHTAALYHAWRYLRGETKHQLWAHPHYLSYFNELAGGPARGHLWLDDSNLDWGQDLKRLGAYQQEHGIARIKLRTSPVFQPEAWGVRWEPLTDEEWAFDRPPGLYAMSAQLLIRGEYHAQQTGQGTDWLSRYEPVARIGYSIYLFRFP